MPTFEGAPGALADAPATVGVPPAAAEVPATFFGKVTTAQPTAITCTAASKPSSHIATMKVRPKSFRALSIWLSIGIGKVRTKAADCRAMRDA